MTEQQVGRGAAKKGRAGMQVEEFKRLFDRIFMKLGRLERERVRTVRLKVTRVSPPQFMLAGDSVTLAGAPVICAHVQITGVGQWVRALQSGQQLIVFGVE